MDRQEITESLINFHSEIQTDITDYSTVSVIRGLFYSFATQLEFLYDELEEIKKQSYIVTATDKYLDRLIDGTFGLSRNPEQGAGGYVVFYANSPIQEASQVIFNVATADGKTIQNAETAVKINATGQDGGKSFVAIRPNNTSFSVFDTETNTFRLTLPENSHYQYLILPVISTQKGVQTNVVEGNLNSIVNAPTGIDGVINTSDLKNTFFEEQAGDNNVPFEIRFTTVNSLYLDSDLKSLIFTTNNASYFSQDGFFGLEDERGTPWMGIYAFKDSQGVISSTRFIEDRLRIEYNQAQTKYVQLSNLIGVEKYSAPISEQELPSIFRYDEQGNEYEYVLQRVYLGQYGQNNAISFARRGTLSGEAFEDSLPGKRFLIFLQSIANGIVIRQLRVKLDNGLVFDPDNVLSKDGVIIPAALIGGGKNVESDPSYRIRLQKYLASLARATKTALEVGALTVDGISYAVSFPEYENPRGTTVILVSNSDGTVSGRKLAEVKRVLDQSWKAAGIHLIVKTPERINVSVMMQVTLRSRYQRTSVDTKIRYELTQYFASKLPGDRVSYSEVISVIQNVEGVLNAWSTLIGKKLTNSFFLTPGNRIKNVQGVWTGYVYELIALAFQSSALHSLPLRSTSTFISPVGTDSLTQANIFRRVDFPGQIQIDATWDNFVQNLLLNSGSAEDFSAFITRNHTAIFNDTEITYEMASLLSEPLDKRMVNSQSKIPLDPNLVNLEAFREFKFGAMQIPVAASVALLKKNVPLVGIQYLLES